MLSDHCPHGSRGRGVSKRPSFSVQQEGQVWTVPGAGCDLGGGQDADSQTWGRGLPGTLASSAGTFYGRHILGGSQGWASVGSWPELWLGGGLRGPPLTAHWKTRPGRAELQGSSAAAGWGALCWSCVAWLQAGRMGLCESVNLHAADPAARSAAQGAQKSSRTLLATDQGDGPRSRLQTCLLASRDMRARLGPRAVPGAQ